MNDFQNYLDDRREEIWRKQMELREEERDLDREERVGRKLDLKTPANPVGQKLSMSDYAKLQDAALAYYAAKRGEKR
jgi:hypothetical protein